MIRPSALGDVCRTVPVLVSLRKAFPDAAIDWLVQDTFRDAVEAHPDLSSVVPFDRKAMGRQARTGRLGGTLTFLRSLRSARYDLVLDLQGLFRSGLFAWATRAPTRVGHADARELGWLALNERVCVGPSTHTVDRMLALLEPIGVEPIRDMRLRAPPRADERVRADEELREPYVVLAPTSRWPAKRWPPERFVELAHRVLDELDRRVVLVGGPGERGQCAPLLRLASHNDRVVDRIGSTTVGELMAIIERSSLVVANDSAALHMAVGFDRPIVALFGPTRVDLVGPYRRERDVIQRVERNDALDHKNDGGGRALMERIRTTEVVDAVRSRLAP